MQLASQNAFTPRSTFSCIFLSFHWLLNAALMIVMIPKCVYFRNSDITDVDLLKNNNFPYLTVSIKSDILGIDLICYGLILSEKKHPITFLARFLATPLGTCRTQKAILTSSHTAWVYMHSPGAKAPPTLLNSMVSTSSQPIIRGPRLMQVWSRITFFSAFSKWEGDPFFLFWWLPAVINLESKAEDLLTLHCFELARSLASGQIQVAQRETNSSPGVEWPMKTVKNSENIRH